MNKRRFAVMSSLQHLGSNSFRLDFEHAKIQSPIRRDHERFQSKPACCIRALWERRREKGRFFFCQPLITTTKASEVKKFVDNFFRDNDLSWDIVYAISLDEARVLLERNSHNCNALSFAQTCIGNKNLYSKTGRSIKNCGVICELCAK